MTSTGRFACAWSGGRESAQQGRQPQRAAAESSRREQPQREDGESRVQKCERVEMRRRRLYVNILLPAPTLQSRTPKHSEALRRIRELRRIRSLRPITLAQLRRIPADLRRTPAEHSGRTPTRIPAAHPGRTPRHSGRALRRASETRDAKPITDRALSNKPQRLRGCVITPWGSLCAGRVMIENGDAQVGCPLPNPVLA
jgi:hypothetical protein